MSEEKNIKYTFWTDKPTILYENDNYLRFVPDSSMTRVEQLNAITRFSIYLIILTLLFNKQEKWLYIPLVLIVLTVILYHIYDADPEGRKKELILEKFGSMSEEEGGRTYDIESGFYDSEGNLVVGPHYGALDKRREDINYSADELIQYQQARCKKPTKENPFMNPLVSEYGTENVPVACNADDEEVKDAIEDNFHEDLFRDIDDLFNVKNSQRQFYTIAGPQVPPDQPAFAHWLYKMENTCKDDQEQCLRYEDLRFKR
jgi:hypothetical protein